MALRIAMILLLVSLFLGGCSPEKIQFQSTQRRAYRVQKIEEKYPEWDDVTIQKVASRRVEIGMTREMVWEALGEPDTISPQGNEEKWGYAVIVVPGDAPRYKKFVYFVQFKEGRVVRTTGDPSQLSNLGW